MELVVNEWLPEWLSPKGNGDEFKKANRFLYRFFTKGDVLVVKYNSRFTEKLLQYPKLYSGYPENALKLSFVISQILDNSLKCRQLYDNEILPLPHEVASLLPAPFDSDRYLFEAAFSSQDKVIVTTDARLIEQTKDNGIIRVIHFDEFILHY